MNTKWNRDSALLLAIIVLVLGYKGNHFLYYGGLLLVFCAIFIPVALTPIGYIWKKVADIFALVVPKIFFGLVYVFLVTPIGFAVRYFYAEKHYIQNWKSSQSTFKERNHQYVADDLMKPY